MRFWLWLVALFDFLSTPTKTYTAPWEVQRLRYRTCFNNYPSSVFDQFPLWVRAKVVEAAYKLGAVGLTQMESDRVAIVLWKLVWRQGNLDIDHPTGTILHMVARGEVLKEHRRQIAEYLPELHHRLQRRHLTQCPPRMIVETLLEMYGELP